MSLFEDGPVRRIFRQVIPGSRIRPSGDIYVPYSDIPKPGEPQAYFHAYIQKSPPADADKSPQYKITIPLLEGEELGLESGDLVGVLLWPTGKRRAETGRL